MVSQFVKRVIVVFGLLLLIGVGVSLAQENDDDTYWFYFYDELEGTITAVSEWGEERFFSTNLLDEFGT